LGDDNDLVGRIPELLIKGQANATLAIDRVGSIDVPGEAEDDSPRTGENRRLSATGVFVAQLNTTSNQKTGHVVYGKHGDKQFLGVYARGLTAGQDYEVKINGQVVASLTANATGVIATRVDISQVANFPTIASGLNVSVGDYTGTFQALSERVHLPKTVYVANLSGGSLVGAAQIATAENRTMIGIQLGRVAANTTYDVTVDNVKIAQVTSTRRGFIFFNFDSKRGDTLLADLPTLTADSVIKIGDLVTAKLRKFGR
jgi:RNase P/RNase MRP subunit p29